MADDAASPGQTAFYVRKIRRDFGGEIIAQVAYHVNFTGVVAGEGIEPPTQGFSVLCSTD